MADDFPSFKQAQQNVSPKASQDVIGSGGPQDFPTFQQAQDQSGDLFTKAWNGLKTGVSSALHNNPITGPVADMVFDQEDGPHKRIVDAFKQGFRDNYGALNWPDQVDDYFRKTGIYSDYHDKQQSLLKTFNDAFMRPVVNGMLEAGRIGASTMQATVPLLQQTGREIERPAKALDESDIARRDPTGILKGVATAIGGTGEYIGALPEYLPEAHIPEISMHVADGPYGKSEGEWFGTKTPSPEDRARTTKALGEMGPPQHQMNVETIARANNPELARKWDALNAERDRILAQIKEPTEQVPNPEWHDALKREQDILAKVAGDESKLTKGDAVKLAEARDDRASTSEFLPPEAVQEAFRERYRQNFAARQELAPQVAREARTASDQLGAIYQPETAEKAPEASVAPAGKAVFDDVRDKLVKAKVDPEEAKVHAAIVQAYYETRAAKFEGKRGTAEDLYKKEAPDVVRAVKRSGKKSGKRLSQFIGPRSETAPKDKFNTAVQMEQKGVSNETIRLATGWSRGLDNKWKYEISDKDATLISTPVPPKGINLDQVLHHPALFDAYPEARNITVTHKAAPGDTMKTYQGWLNKESNSINITPYGVDKLGTLIHELQHWIQEKEGFAGGGSVGNVLEKLPLERREKLFEKSREEVTNALDALPGMMSKAQEVIKDFDFQKAITSKNTADKFWDAGEKKDWYSALNTYNGLKNELRQKLFGPEKQYSDLNVSEKSLYNLFLRVIDPIDESQRIKPEDIISILDKEMENGFKVLKVLESGDTKMLQAMMDHSDLHHLYESLAGEIEARDTTARRTLTEEDRAVTPPGSSTEAKMAGNRPVEEPIISFNQIRRGALDLMRSGRNVLTLFKDADASTFMHEMGHQFLEDLVADSNHELATESMKADAETVRGWYNKTAEGLKKPWLFNGPIPVAAHEMWARGFERYLMEGKAPTTGLAKVFQQFKDWLTKIYEKVSKLKTPINDDIRDVFDRLLNKHSDNVGLTNEPIEDGAFHTPNLQAGSTETKYQGVNPADRTTPETTPESAGAPLKKRLSQDKFFENDGKIRFDSFTSDEDMQQFLHEFWDRHAGELNDRKGNLTTSERLDMGDLLGKSGKTVQTNLNKLARMFTEDKIPVDVRFHALKEALLQNTQRLMDMAAKDDAIGFSDASILQVQLGETFAGIRTAWGRLGRELQGADADGKAALTEAEQVNRLLQNSVGKTLDQVKVDMARVRQFTNPKQVAGYLKHSYGDMALEAYRNYLIAGYKTHTTYAIANEAQALTIAGPEAFFAGVARNVREALGGKTEPGQGRSIREAQTGLTAFLFGHKDAFRSAGRAFMEGQTQALPGENLANTPFTKQQAIPGIAGKIIRAPGERMVAPIHSYSRELMFQVARRQIITRKVLDEGLDFGSDKYNARVAELLEHTPDDINKEAVKTSTENSLMGPGGKWLKKIQNVATTEVHIPLLDRLNQTPGQYRQWAEEEGLKPGTAEFDTRVKEFTDQAKPFTFQPFAFLVSPFIHVSGNVMRMGMLDYSPLGTFGGEVQAALMGKKGTLAQDTAWGKMAVGTSLWGALGGLAYLGMTNPSRSPNHKKAAADLYEKGLPSSIRIGDMSYDITRLGIMGQTLALGIDLWEAARLGVDHASLHDFGVAFAHDIWEHAAGEGWLSGFSDLINANDNPDVYGESWVRNFISSVAVPFSVGSYQISTLVDPYQRRVDAQDFWGKVGESIEDKIPFVSERLEPRIDIFGQPVPNKHFYGLYAQQIHDDPLTQFLVSKGWFPSPVQKKIMGVQLTPEQYTAYATIAGRSLRLQLDQMFEMPQFKQAPVQIQHDMVKTIVSTARQTAQGTIIAASRGTDNDIAVKAENQERELYNQ